MNTRTWLSALGLTATALTLPMCSGSSSSPASPTASGSTASSSSTTTTATTTTLPAIYAKFGNGTHVSLDGATVVITSTDVPDHKSPYFGVGNANYVAPTAGVVINPNTIAAQSTTYRIPVNPVKATPSDTPLGSMGIATNGVALFNQYAAGRVALTTEVISFDQFNGHPTGSNEYHYHFEPLWLTAASRAAFIGVLLDGFPVYGPADANGSTPSDLDSCNGHIGTTADYPNGIYHYHVTTAVPYIAGCFYGTPGTLTGG